jgi:hypothetical protein
MFSFCSVLKIENFAVELVNDDDEFGSVVLCEDGLSNGHSTFPAPMFLHVLRGML